MNVGVAEAYGRFEAMLKTSIVPAALVGLSAYFDVVALDDSLQRASRCRSRSVL